MNSKLWLTGLGLFLTTLLGCRTDGIMLRETPLSISETRKAIVSVIGEPRLLSPNGRELYSRYYDKKSQPIERMELARERFNSHVTILGDRRPYDIEVEVLVEERDEDGRFQVVEKDEDMAKPVADKIKKTLYQSLDSRNLIDDFRSF